MNSEFYIKARKVFREPGLFDEEDIFHIHNVGIRLTKQIEETICKNGDIGIRRLFYNISELRDLYNQHKKSYFENYAKGKRDDVTAEMLTTLSEAIGQLLRLSFYYFTSQSRVFVKEFEEHCPALLKLLKNRPYEDVELDKLKYTEPEPIRQAEYFHLLAHTGVINAVMQKTDEETAKEIDPDILSNNNEVLTQCNIELLFMYFKVNDFNLSNARAYVNDFKKGKGQKQHEKPKQQEKTIKLITKMNQIL